MSEKRVCKYDSQPGGCYQKNPAHFTEFSHPNHDAQEATAGAAASSEQQQPPAAAAGTPSKSKAKQQQEQSQQQQQQLPPASPAKPGDDDLPEARESPLTGSNDPSLVFEMPYPLEQMRSILAIAKKHNAADPLKAFPGLTLCGAFDVMHNGANFTSDKRKWMFCREVLHPPEAQTFARVDSEVFQTAVASSGSSTRRARGKTSNNNDNDNDKEDEEKNISHTLCFFHDDPDQAPIVVGCHGVGGRDVHGLHSDLGRTLVHVLRASLGSSAAVRELADTFKPGPFTNKELTDFANARSRSCPARSWSGIGCNFTYDRKEDLGYRPPLINKKRLQELLEKINAGTQSKPEKAEMHNQLMMADVANDECDFGLSLELGLNFLYSARLDAERGNKRIVDNYVWKNAMRMLSIVYALLNRDLLGHIAEVIAIANV